MPRAFVAIELSESVLEAFRLAGDAFRTEAPEWAGEKWVAPRNLHATLLFLGDVQDVEVPAVSAALEAACREHVPFTLGVAGLDAVPGGRRSRMLWGRLSDPEEGASALAGAVRRDLAPWTTDPAVKPFQAHVTLVRARRPRAVPPDALTAANAVVTTPAPAMSVRCATLFASTLTRTGPVYEILARAVLGNA